MHAAGFVQQTFRLYCCIQMEKSIFEGKVISASSNPAFHSWYMGTVLFATLPCALWRISLGEAAIREGLPAGTDQFMLNGKMSVVAS